MQPTATRPAPCQGPGCHACAPVPVLGTGQLLYNGPNPPWGGKEIGAVATGDLDGDGIRDLVVSDPTVGAVGVILDRGDGTWSPPTTYPVGGKPGAVVVTDLNGDGWPDVLVLDAGDGTGPGWVDVLQGLPGGVLELTGELAVGRSPNALAVGDVDGDGNPDVVVTNGGDGTLGVSLGRGNGTFGEETTYPAGRPVKGLALADFDGDGHLDAAVAQSVNAGDIYVLHGRGDGSFGAARLAITGMPLGRFEAADLDGDGRMDLITMTPAVEDQAPTADLLTPALGRGDGTFVAGTPVSLGGIVINFDVGDLDGDGAVDLVATTVAGIETLHNDGHGRFAEAGPVLGTGFLPGAQTPMTLADLNGDGHPDLVVGDRYSFNLRMNQGDGTFPVPVYASREPVTHLQLADLNGAGEQLFDLNDDGYLDVVVSTWQKAASVAFGVSALLGQAGGTLSPGPVDYGPDPFPRSLYSFTVGKVDGDGVPDLVLVGFDGNVQVRLGQGDGSFVQATAFQQRGVPMSPILADVDGDGHTDLLLALELSKQVAVRLGRGDGTFQDAVTYPVDGAPNDIALGDLDGDGIPDLVAATSKGVTVLRGHGDGTFTMDGTFATPFDALDYGGLALGDLDGDGHLDVVTAGMLGAGVCVLRGRGDGSLDKAVVYPGPTNTDTYGQIGIADMDGDGVPDLVVGGYGVGVLHGRGDGTFDPVVLFSDDGLGEAMAISDLDANGQPDLVLGGWGVGEVLDPPPLCATR